MIKPIASTLVVMSLLLSSSAAYSADANANGGKASEGSATMETTGQGHTGEERKDKHEDKREDKHEDKRQEH